MEETIVKEWLCSLKMGQYAASFIDNGYDDLEICKQIDAPDLDAIGVVDLQQRSKLLQAVQILRVEGAASVYFTVEEAQAARLQSVSRNSDPGPYKEPIKKNPQGTGSSASTPGDVTHMISGICNVDIDAYEAGKAELVRLPQLHLRQLLKESLEKDKVELTVHPYTSEEGQRGVLEGLASRYADIFNTHYQDVLEHLEYLRCHEWNSLVAQRAKAASVAAKSYPFLHGLSPGEQTADFWSPRSSSSSSSSDDDDIHPIYLPGKYNPSSCLSDAEEDQIYGFTGPTPVSTASKPLPGCLNPRSQHIYELPPTRGRPNQNGTKKRLGFGRFLKTLKRDLKKSSDTKNKHYLTHNMISAPRPLNGSDLSSTPLVVLPGYSSPTSSHCSQSSKSHSSSHSFVVNSTSAPGTPGSSGPMRDSGLQEAIEKLKQQEIQKRREDQFREHEQVLQDLRFGLARAKHKQAVINTPTYAPIPSCYDSSYEHEEEVKPKPKPPTPSHNFLFQHWYDEPPYESDPEDFLISKDKARDTKAANRLDEDVISLKTAGDITLSRDMVSSVGPQEWLLDKNGYPRDVIEMQARGAGEQTVNQQTHCIYGAPTSSTVLTMQASAKGDFHYIASRMSGISVNTNCSDKKKPYLTPQHRRASASDEGHSTNPSDFEDEESKGALKKRKDSASLVGRMKVLHRDMQKKIIRLRGSRECLDFEHDQRKDQFNNGHYQRQSSLPVKWRMGAGKASPLELRPTDRVVVAVVCQVRALVDHLPTYDVDGLKFKKGDVIDVLSKCRSGLWKGHLNGAVGYFKCTLAEEMTSLPASRHPKRFGISQEVPNAPSVQIQDVPTLLSSLQLSHLTQVFLMNGVNTMEAFRKIRVENLSSFGISNPEVINKILSVVMFLEENAGAAFVRSTNTRTTLPASSPPSSCVYYQNAPVPSSAGCQLYENAAAISYSEENNLDSRVSSSSTDTSSGYHSRATYNIPFSCKSPPCESSPARSVDGVPRSQPPEISPRQEAVHLSGSYHAHVALVEPSAAPSSAHTEVLKPTLC